MHWFDLVILGLVIWFAVKGIMNGMVMGLFRLLGLLLGTLLAARYGSGLGHWFVQQFNAPPQAGVFLGYAAVFVTIVLASQILAGMVRSLLDFVLLGWLDKAGGVIFGAVKAILIAFVVFFAMGYLPQNPITDGITRGSRFYVFYQENAPGLYARLIQPFLKEKQFSRPLRSPRFRRGEPADVIGSDLFRQLLEGTEVFNDKELEFLVDKFSTIDMDKQKSIIDELRKGNTAAIYDMLTGSED